MWSEQGTWVALAMLLIPGFSLGNEDAAMRQRDRQGVERLDDQRSADADEGTEDSGEKVRGKPSGTFRGATGT